MLIHGSCHCRNISYLLDWEPHPVAIPARACSCTFCVKHGGVWTSCPTGSLKVRVKDPSAVSKYAFGTRTADFHVCARCGAVPLVTSVIEGRAHAVVNVNTMEGVAPELFVRSAVTFDDEEGPARLARRARAWIPDVEFSAGAA